MAITLIEVDWEGEEPTEDMKREAREQVALHARTLDEEFEFLQMAGLM